MHAVQGGDRACHLQCTVEPTATQPRHLQQTSTADAKTTGTAQNDEEQEGWLRFNVNWILGYRQLTETTQNIIFLGLAGLFMCALIASIWMCCSLCLYPSQAASVSRRHPQLADTDNEAEEDTWRRPHRSEDSTGIL